MNPFFQTMVNNTIATVVAKNVSKVSSNILQSANKILPDNRSKQKPHQIYRDVVTEDAALSRATALQQLQNIEARRQQVAPELSNSQTTLPNEPNSSLNSSLSLTQSLPIENHLTKILTGDAQEEGLISKIKKMYLKRRDAKTHAAE